MRKSISTIAAINAFLFIGLYLFFRISFTSSSTDPSPMDWSISAPTDDTSFGGLFSTPQISDSLPYYVYRKIEDSFKVIQTARDMENKGWIANDIPGTKDIGVFYIRKKDGDFLNNHQGKDESWGKTQDSLNILNETLSTLKNKDSIEKVKKEMGDILFRYNQRQNELLQEKMKNAELLYYIGLNNYSLDMNSKFFMQNDTYNLAYVKWDTTIKRTYDSTKAGHYERRQIPVRFASENKIILIPTSKHKYKTIGIFLEIFTYLNMFVFAYCFIGIPIQILVNISRGNAFSLKTIKRFKLMAYVTLGYGIINTISPFLVNFIFHKLIPPEFSHPSFFEVVMNNIWIFIFSLASFISGKVFEKGYSLQDEQALTI